MSRHRSPGGQNAHPRLDTRAGAPPRAPSTPTAPRTAGTRQARHRAVSESAVRNGMTAAAAAGGLLAVVAPALPVPAPAVPSAAAEDRTVLRLTADEVSVPSRPSAAAGAEEVRLLASLLPVSATPEPEPPVVDVSDLLKAAGLADLARRAEELRAAREATADCDADLDGLGRVKPWVRDAARFLSCLFDEPTLIGVSGRSRNSDHPGGLAIDLMVRGERGDRIASCALANQEALGITYVIWKQRVNFGDGWERMEDRGSDTENHFDHVHISFERRPPGDIPVAALCD